jgi:hypothetical protein
MSVTGSKILSSISIHRWFNGWRHCELTLTPHSPSRSLEEEGELSYPHISGVIKKKF